MDHPAKFLPQLPGYRPKTLNNAMPRPQIFKRVKGESFVNDENTASVGEIHMEDSSVLSIGTMSRPGTAQSAKGCTVTNKVLTFQAFYDDEANGAGPSVRQSVYLYYFVDDSSIKVVIAPKKRGGDRSGTKLRRSVVLKESGEPFSAEDFRLGSSVIIYGRSYYIVDCDQATRDYITDGLISSPEPQEQPVDFSGLLVDAENSYEHDWGAYRPKKNELKIYMEAKMGNTINNSKREGFIAYGNTVLKFLCFWDDSRNMYGKRHEYAIIYHLADDTVDITSVSRNADGGECKQLLKRAKLPKPSSKAKNSSGEFLPNPGKDGVYHWSDFCVGDTIEVYTRSFVIIDADEATRKFFLDNGLELAPAVHFEVPPAKEYVREVPPHVGFGSEEDSLRSCTGSVSTGAPRQKKINPDAAVLVFLADLVSSDPVDLQRKFVVTFYVDDNTIKILEPPQRNSGFVGGMFLSRQKMKATTGKFFTQDMFDVGQTITVSSHHFLLTGADSGTQKYLDQRNSHE